MPEGCRQRICSAAGLFLWVVSAYGSDPRPARPNAGRFRWSDRSLCYAVCSITP
jgi:hypothetical protein